MTVQVARRRVCSLVLSRAPSFCTAASVTRLMPPSCWLETRQMWVNFTLSYFQYVDDVNAVEMIGGMTSLRLTPSCQSPYERCRNAAARSRPSRPRLTDAARFLSPLTMRCWFAGSAGRRWTGLFPDPDRVQFGHILGGWSAVVLQCLLSASKRIEWAVCITAIAVVHRPQDLTPCRTEESKWLI